MQRGCNRKISETSPLLYTAHRDLISNCYKLTPNKLNVPIPRRVKYLVIFNS